MVSGVELKKVDEQGRLILPAHWREAELGESRKLYVIKRKGYLKIIPKRHIDLTDFDKADLGVDSIGSWKQFEKRRPRRHKHLKLDSKDALVINVMKINDIREIYSFDEDFDEIQGIKRLPII